MAIQKCARGIAAAVGRVVGRGVRAARIRRLEWHIDRQKSALGKTMYPLLQSDQLQTDQPEVLDRMMRIRALIHSVDELRAGARHGGTDQLAQNEDEARWADEGGQNVG